MSSRTATSCTSASTSDPARLPPGCVAECPGCRYRSVDYDESLKLKHEWLRRALAPWADLIEPVRPAPEELRWGYRRKTTLHAEWRDGRWVFGLLGSRAAVGNPATGDFPGASRWQAPPLIPIPDCPVHDPRINRALTALSTLQSGLPGPDEFPLRFAIVAGTILTLVVKAREPSLRAMNALGAIRFDALGFTGVFLNLNPSAGKRVTATNGWKLLQGEPRAPHGPSSPGSSSGSSNNEFGIHGPAGFQQTIPALARSAYDEAERFLSPGPGDQVADLYSGTGRTLMRWVDRGANAIGVELSAECVETANSVRPGICLRGRVSDRLPQLSDWAAHTSRANGRLLVFANPPRTGLEPKTLDWVAGSSAARLACLSCSAGTLGRDLAGLGRAGFKISRLLPFDFFPRTHHVEILAMLTG